MTKSELIRLMYIFIGILIMGLFEVVGVSSIAPFIAVVTSPELIHENIYINSLYVFFDFNTDVNFIVFLGICVISILLLSNSYIAFMTSVITYFSTMMSFRLQVRLLENYLMQPYSFFLDRNTSDLGKNIINERLSNVLLDEEQLPIEDLFLNHIICIHCLEHSENLKKTFICLLN